MGLENKYKSNILKPKLKKIFPGSFVLHLNPNELQGVPDLVVLHTNGEWSALEGKKSINEPYRPNQEYYIEMMNNMSYASMICPENQDNVIRDIIKKNLGEEIDMNNNKFKYNNHYKLIGKHAFLSASKYNWLDYDDDKLLKTYANHTAAQKGTELHEFAAKAIQSKIRVKDEDNILTQYVSDCIDYNMTPEVILYYSEFCFGTADAIFFDGKNLYIFDLKTGKSKTSFKQLYLYTAIFCLEYNIDITKLNVKLRIYQHGTFEEENSDNEFIDCIRTISEKIIYNSKLLQLTNNNEGDISWYF